MILEDALAGAGRQLEIVSDSARLDAELLMMFVLRSPRSTLFAHPERELSTSEVARFTELVARRADREPVAYLTGEKEFWSLMLSVSADTLVPRPETELLVEQALESIPEDSDMRVLDLGTGSGAIAIAIASGRPNCTLVATDISQPALKVAEDNARRHRLTNISFPHGNWLEAVAGQTFDLIVTNPPYIARNASVMTELAHEPRPALVSGKDGLDAIRCIAADAREHLNIGGVLIIEHGADQERAVANILKENRWSDIRCLTDLRGLPRVTRAEWAPNSSD